MKRIPLILVLIFALSGPNPAHGQKFLKKVTKAVDKVLGVESTDNKAAEPAAPVQEVPVEAVPEEAVESETADTIAESEPVPVTPYEPLFLGFNGNISSVEVNGNEVFSFDNEGRLLERVVYADAAKKKPVEKDTYKRDSDGNVIEEYKGFNLNDVHYIGESLWRKVEEKDGVEIWQKIEDNWWCTSYRNVMCEGNKKFTYHYDIQKSNGQEANENTLLETFNERGQVIASVKETKAKGPKYIYTYEYNEDGHLLKKELETVFPDGTVNNTVDAEYTVHEVDGNNNPLKVTDDKGNEKVYRYTYR